MNWSKGYTVSFYAVLVDQPTWKDTDRVEIESGSIKKDRTNLLQSADLKLQNRDDLDLEKENWIRVYADVRQTGDNYHIPLFTGLTSTPSKDIDGTKRLTSATCYSVLKPAEDILLSRGWYAPANTDAANIVKSLLSVGPASVSIDGVSGNLQENVVAEDNETNLSMAWKILDLMNWNIFIDGNGYITIGAYPVITNDAVIFDSLENDSLETQINITYDWFNCPNVFRAVQDTAISVARDEDPDSVLSIPSRGREIWMEETNCVLKTNESLGDYAKRRLKEEQSVAYEVSYTRRFHPDVDIEDIIKLNYPAQDSVGYFKISDQNINLSHGIAVAETATKVV